MDLSTTIRVDRQEWCPRGIGYLLGGVALVTLSAAINVRHTVAHAADQLDMLLTGGLALAMTVAFVVLPAFAVGAFRDRAFGFATATGIGVIICGGISLTNIVGASMGQRLTASVEATDATRKRSDAKKLIETHDAEIATMGPMRSSATVQADIDAKLTSRNDLEGCEAKWLVSAKARSVCIDVHQLRAELAKAERKAMLESEVAQARGALNGTKAGATVGRGDTAAIIAAGRKFGWELDGESVDLAKSVGLALGVELFAALLFVAWERARQVRLPALSLAAVPASALSQAVVATVETPSFAVIADAGPPVPRLECLDNPVGEALAADLTPALVPARPTVDAASDDAVLAALCARGGALLASQRTMADMFGMSRSSVNRALHDLAASGRVKLVATAKGTAVTLVVQSAKAA